MAYTHKTHSMGSHPRTTARTSHFPQFLFNSTFRYTIIRLVCITAAANAGINAKRRLWNDLGIALGIMGHHLLSSLGPYYLVPGIFEWGVIGAEFGWSIYNLRWLYIASQRTPPFKFNSSMDRIYATTVRWILILLLGVILLHRSIRIYEGRIKALVGTVDLSQDHWVDYDDLSGRNKYWVRRESDSHSGTTDDGRKGKRWKLLKTLKPTIRHANDKPWWVYPRDILFGRSLWKRMIPGERLSIVIPRGLMAAMSILILIPFSVLRLILEPTYEVGSLPIRELRGIYRPDAGLEDREISNKPNQTVLVKFHGANSFRPEYVNITAYEDDTEYYATNSPEPINCDFEMQERWKDPESVVAMYICPPTSQSIAVTMNFTRFPRSAQTPLNPEVFFSTRSLKETLQEFQPTRFIPGTNLLAIQDRLFRQKLKEATWSTFGLYDDQDIFFIYPIRFLIPDPEVLRYRLPRGRGISTIRTSVHFVQTGTYATTIQDNRDRSALKGISSIGGLGSFLSFISTFIFGSSLFGIILGHKPLSPFGLIHSFKRHKEPLLRECEKRYTGLRTEIEALEMKPGIIKFLLNTIIDLDVIITSLGQSERETRNEEGEVALGRESSDGDTEGPKREDGREFGDGGTGGETGDSIDGYRPVRVMDEEEGHTGIEEQRGSRNEEEGLKGPQDHGTSSMEDGEVRR